MPSKMLSEILSPKMLIVFLLGFASGFPLLLTGSTFKLWLAQGNIDVKTIGLMSLVGTAYSLKFLWAPLVDRYSYTKLGRRKSWLILTQLALAICLYGISKSNLETELYSITILAIAVAFFSATQDVVIDAYRREYLEESEMGLGSSVNVYGYRVAMWIAGGILVAQVADTSLPVENKISWNQFYFISSIIFFLIATISFFLPEPQVQSQPKTLMGAVIEPFKDFLKRKEAWTILIFIFLFKLGDQISGSLLSKFYKDMGFLNSDIGYITKTVGLFSSFIGLFIGGAALLRFSTMTCLWIFGILQALSTALFSILVYSGPQNWALGLVVSFEDLTSGMGTAAFVAYMASITNKQYTATQFALLTSLAALGRTFFSGSSGYLQSYLGWAGFFYLGSILAIPGLVLLWRLRSAAKTGS